MKKYFDYIAGGLIASLLIIPIIALGATQYGAGTLLQVGDVQTSHILNGTITNDDINTGASIGIEKITATTTQGLLYLSNGTKIATSSNLRYASSTNDFWVSGGRINATSTNFNGVNHTWPSADGTANQTLSTDGAGTLSWVSAGGASLSSTFTAGETINTGDAVVIASSTTNRVFYPRIGTLNAVDFGRTTNSYHAGQISTTTAICTRFIGLNLETEGTPTDSVAITFESDSAGNPSSVSLASTTRAAADIAATPTYYVLPLSSELCFTAGTAYWLTFKRTGALDDTNYYQSSRGTVTQNRGNANRLYTAGSWGADAGQWMQFDMGITTQSGNAYRTNSQYNGFYEAFVGFAQATTTASSTVTVITSGVANNVDGVAIAGQYYLSNVFGNLLTTVGLNTRKAAQGVANLTALITNIW